jgi:hypothetical protein
MGRILRFVAAVLITFAAGGVDLSAAPIRLFLFTAALPPGIDAAGSARRSATLADLRQILSRDQRIVLTDTPEEADVLVELTASRLTRRADDSLIETIQLAIVAAQQRGEVRGTAQRSFGRWKDAALDASRHLFEWLDVHRGALAPRS